jgi:hypothetical protein
MLLAQTLHLFLGPVPIVLGEAYSVEPRALGEGDELMRVEIAVVRARSGVGVKVDYQLAA